MNIELNKSRRNTLLTPFINLLMMVLIGVFFSQCNPSKAELEKGIWRATLERTDGQQIIFNFEVKDSMDQPVIYIFNSNDRLKVDSITFVGEDSLHIQMPFFDSYFALKKEPDGSLSGNWIKDYGTRVLKMPFKAVPNDSLRILAHQDATADVSGHWDTRFLRKDKPPIKTIGQFTQDGNQVTGTFLSPTGDYRFLQGIVSGDTLKLSGFDGSHAIVFTALIDSNKTLRDGKIYSTNSPASNWYAHKKDYDSLPASYALKSFQPGSTKIDFSLKDIRTGEQVSLDDERFKNKVVIISILGSWCPNCMDEAPFLTHYYNENHDRGVEILGVAFERTDDFDQSKQALQSFFHRFQINYPVLFSGVAFTDPDLTEKTFPGLPEKISAFPTTIFLDKSGYVRVIHKGFNGPATGKFYEEGITEFKEIVENLLAEE